MVSDELAPLEAHVEAQVKHLTAVAGVVRELRSAEQQYGQEYAELPFDVPAEVKETLKRLPQLQGVTQRFGHFVHRCSKIKAALAEDLTKEVIAPVEAFTVDHIEKAQHLLSEMYELLQKEKAFDLAYENLREGCKKDEAPREKSAASESTSSPLDEGELELHRMHRDQLLRRRDAERLAIQQWITALHFAGQRYEAHVRDVRRRTCVVFERMIASLTALISEVQNQLQSEGANTTNTLVMEMSDCNNSSAVSEECCEGFLAGYDCHVAITSWMGELFKQLIPVEHKAAKRLRKAIKLDRALSKAFGGVGFSSQLSGLIEFHGLLTVNIANPIMRTLKFTKERQERMRNELSQSLEETRTLTAAARARVDASVAKDTVAEKDPVRCDSLTSSETSECSVEDNNEEDQSSSAVALKDKVPVENTPEQSQLETLERKLLLQRQEMARVLEQTSYLAVKTMELMVQDYWKHVTQALAALSETIHQEIPQAIKRNASDDASPQPWTHIAERLSIVVSDQPALPVEENQSNQNPRRCSISKRNTVLRRCRMISKIARGVGEPSAAQVVLSFLQSAVGVAYWASGRGFKTAKSRLPQSFEERAVLVVTAVVLLTLASICFKSRQLQTSWTDLSDTQHSNSEDLVQIVKLSLEVCSQRVGAAATPKASRP
ncbi:hypothetical protein PHYPSEUDO_008227 [Phytophthora pseudosyringae]|uniref:Uncharacterized protein n=1 Tax=Phytophthora pseudosyringae TaxID=221518 RepID=A0A8T1VHX4_9STRA|nr:hypothetical protein PHYPSEUDO_008227 [Phytophthora pseudosyringae]